jgi:A/G-specific adenine glycosylase
MTSFRAGEILLPREVLQETGRRLLRWARENLASLPWRGETDPYRIWVSEVMLQQTRRETVSSYYGRFLAHFPTVEALAAADQQDVLKLWEGLGYYARARSLHAAARRVVAEFGGCLPRERRKLLSLPGIGPYTAGAILSLAFGQDEAAVDGNVRRVLCRLALERRDPRRLEVQRNLWATAGALLIRGQAGRVNEALMELGATVCLPRKPACPTCPLSDLCRARAEGATAVVPLLSRRPPLPHHQVAAAAIVRDGRLLLAQRRLDDLLGGLWEFPGGTCRPGEALEACLQREIAEELGIEIRVGPLLASLRHAYTHFRITLHTFLCRLVEGQPQALECADWRWLTLEEADALPLSVLDRRVLRILRESDAAGEPF